MFLAHICDTISKGKIITIDPKKDDFPEHERFYANMTDFFQDREKSEMTCKSKLYEILNSKTWKMLRKWDKLLGKSDKTTKKSIF